MGGKEIDMSVEGLDAVYVAARAALRQCVVCERPMRPVRSKLADWPATVAYGTATQCKTCYNRIYNKSLSAHSVGKVEGKRVRVRGIGVASNIVVLPREIVAQGWSADERSCALLVCGAAPSSEIADEVLQMLGLFDTDRREFVPVPSNLPGRFGKPAR